MVVAFTVHSTFLISNGEFNEINSLCAPSASYPDATAAVVASVTGDYVCFRNGACVTQLACSAVSRRSANTCMTSSPKLRGGPVSSYRYALRRSADRLERLPEGAGLSRF